MTLWQCSSNVGSILLQIEIFPTPFLYNIFTTLHYKLQDCKYCCSISKLSWNDLDIKIFLRCFRKVTVIDYQGTCSPQESHQSSAPRSLSDSIITVAATFGNFLWTLTLSLNIRNLWQTTLAFANDVMDGNILKIYLCSHNKQNGE